MTQEFRDFFTMAGKSVFLLLLSLIIGTATFFLGFLAIVFFIPSIGHSWTCFHTFYNKIASIQWLNNLLDSVYHFND